jgi:hypothetical protein
VDRVAAGCVKVEIGRLGVGSPTLARTARSTGSVSSASSLQPVCSLRLSSEPPPPQERVSSSSSPAERQVAFGLSTAALLCVWQPEDGKPATRAGVGYTGLWMAVIAARAAVSYGCVHRFGTQLGRWMANHSVTSAAITDALIFIAIGMLLTRVITTGMRAKNLTTHVVGA